MTAERLDSPRKIAVLHAGTLGEFISALPALSAIKRSYPETELTLLTQVWTKEFLTNRPSPVDKVVVIPGAVGIQKVFESQEYHHIIPAPAEDSPEVVRFYGAMQAERFDALLHMQGNDPAISMLMAKIGAKITAGTNSHTSSSPERTFAFFQFQHEILRNIETAGLIGAYTTDLEPHVETTIEDGREIADLLESLGGEPYVVLHPGANDVRKMWAPVKFAAVADYFAERGYKIILTGVPKEKSLLTQIIQYMKHMALAQTTLSVGGLAALLSRASLVIGNDTAPLYLARAVSANTIGIYWAPNLLGRGPITIGMHRAVVSWQVHCPKCEQNVMQPHSPVNGDTKCKHQYSFVDGIPIGDVILRATELLAEKSTPPS